MKWAEVPDAEKKEIVKDRRDAAKHWRAWAHREAVTHLREGWERLAAAEDAAADFLEGK